MAPVRLADARAIWSLLHTERRRVAGIVVLCGLQAVSLVPVTVLVARIFQTDIPRDNTGAILVSGLAILGLYAIWSAVTLWIRWAILTVAARASVRLRGAMIDHVYHMPTAWHSERDMGLLHAIVVNDGERVEYLMIAALIAAAAVAVAAPLVLLACYLAPLPALLLLLIVPLMLAAHRRFGRAVTAHAEVWRRDAAQFSSGVGRALRTLESARVRGADSEEYEARIRALRIASDQMRTRNWLQSVSSTAQGTITALAGLSVLVLGGVAVAASWMTLGHLLAFYAVLALALRESASASGQGAIIVANMPSLRSVLALLADRTPAPYTGSTRIDFDGSVEVSGVRFAYDDRVVLDGVDLTVRPGEVVALVGPNGSGKSTLMSLLLGLYAPSEGSIRMGGHEIATLDLPHLRRQIGVVEQDPVLLPASLRANIAWGRPEASDSEILLAGGRAEALGMRGLDVLDEEVHVGDDGGRLSGGQRQRIAVARALLGRPALLILDEPTNHLDAAAVAALLTTLASLDPAPAVLIITHAPSVAARASRQCVLHDGSVIERSSAAAEAAVSG